MCGEKHKQLKLNATVKIVSVTVNIFIYTVNLSLFDMICLQILLIKCLNLFVLWCVGTHLAVETFSKKT